MSAQQSTNALAGEYYLRGVMETASGFRLGADSTFDFFFSQGALDRSGKGTWSVKNNNILFTSPPRPPVDFAIVQSKKDAGTTTTIQLKDANQYIVKYVYARISAKGNSQEGMLNEEGKISFNGLADSIELRFQFCPEKSSVFATLAPGHNFFEFRFEPWILEYFFTNFFLRIGPDGLSGAHPMLEGDKYTYEKNSGH